MMTPRPKPLLAVLAHPLAAQAVPDLVLRGGHIFDSESGERRAAQLWIAGERILGERPAASEIPEDVTVLDVEGASLLPGLFDLHAHISVAGGSMTGYLAIPPEHNLASALAWGVTNVVDLHAVETSIFSLRDRSRSDPGMARLHAAGAAFTAPGGHPAQLGVATHEVDTEAALDEHFADLLARKPDLIKAVQEHGGWGGLPTMPALQPSLLEHLVEHAHGEGLAVFCHVWSLDEPGRPSRRGSTPWPTASSWARSTTPSSMPCSPTALATCRRCRWSWARCAPRTASCPTTCSPC